MQFSTFQCFHFVDSAKGRERERKRKRERAPPTRAFAVTHQEKRILMRSDVPWKRVTPIHMHFAFGRAHSLMADRLHAAALKWEQFYGFQKQRITQFDFLARSDFFYCRAQFCKNTSLTFSYREITYIFHLFYCNTRSIDLSMNVQCFVSLHYFLYWRSGTFICAYLLVAFYPANRQMDTSFTFFRCGRSFSFSFYLLTYKIRICLKVFLTRARTQLELGFNSSLFCSETNSACVKQSLMSLGVYARVDRLLFIVKNAWNIAITLVFLLISPSTHTVQ